MDRELYQREVDLQRDAANKGGPAAAYCHVVTRGEGAFNFARRIDFGVTFIEEPFMHFGSKVDLDDVVDLGFEEPVASGTADSGVQNIPKLPHSTGYVTNWDRDDHGNYVGAWVAVMVTYPYAPGVAGDPLPIRHFFTFQAVAIKDLSDNDEDIPPAESTSA